ncbi:hypothetical protein ACPR111641_11875 [Acinetobacter pragensis]
MNIQTNLPVKITNIKVCANQDELGVLTYGSVHHYQPTQETQHVSLTMTQKGMDGYSSGNCTPYLLKTSQKALIADLLQKNLPDMQKSMTCIYWHCKVIKELECSLIKVS